MEKAFRNSKFLPFIPFLPGSFPDKPHFLQRRAQESRKGPILSQICNRFHFLFSPFPL